MASMDEKRPLAIYDAAQALDPNAARMDRRRNAHDVLSLQRQTLDRLENELLEGLRGLGDELARSLVEDRAARQAEIRDDLRPQLDELHRQLASAKAELESNRASWEQARIDAGRFEQELRVREILLREAQAQQEHRVSELAMLREQLFDAKAQGSVATERLEQLRREVADRNQNANTADGEAARLRDDAQQLRVLSERQRDEAQQLRILSERQRDELAGFASKSDGLAAENGRLREALEQAQQAAANLANGASSEATQALAELGKAQAQLAANVAEMTQLQGAIEAAQQSSASSADELARAVARQNSAQEEVSCLRAEYEAISAQLAEADARLKSAPQGANTADGEVAQLRDEAQQLLVLSERQRDELAEFASKSDGLTAENGRLREALEQAQQAAANLANGASSEATQALAELAEAQVQLAANVAEMTQLQGAIEAAQQSSASSADELARAVARQNSAREEVSRLRTEYEAISTQLAAADARLKSAPESASDSEDLQGRLELALDEVRELKRANSDLKSKLDKARTAPGAAAPAAPGGGLDWEAQKQRLLASLEADDEDEPDEERAAEKATIKETIRATDLAIAKKDEEIAELRREVDQLSADSHGISDATAALLDADEIIRQERERLVQLQAEWRDRIGKAEMELSVERARLGRDRAEMADKLQQMGPTANMRPSAPDPNDPGKAGRGRWLSRLGLKEVDEKQGG